MTDDEELQQMKEQMQKGKRTDAAADEQPNELHEDIVEQLRAIDESGQKTIAVRDESLTALLGALDDRDEDRADAVDQLAAAAGRDADSATKSELVRLAVRVGLQEATPELWEEVLEAKKARAVDQA